MKKPYIIVHMMMSLDGKIACSMTAQLAGNREYYSTLAALDAPSRVSGRVTASAEMSEGNFQAKKAAVLGHPAFQKHTTAASYNIVTDSYGKTLWGQETSSDFPHLILTSENVSRDYLDYLNQRGISWIAAGKKEVDLKQAMTVLGQEFGIPRLAVVGGGTINGRFLKAGLVDEISVVLGPGVDGRQQRPALFMGLDSDSPLPLQLKAVKSYADGAVWLRYLVK